MDIICLGSDHHLIMTNKRKTLCVAINITVLANNTHIVKINIKAINFRIVFLHNQVLPKVSMPGNTRYIVAYLTDLERITSG